VAFEIGDKVIYPNHGLGVIERIETKTIMGTTCGFYQLRMAGETTVFVPVDNVDGVGLRRAINDDEVQRLFNLLGDGKIDSHQNWKGRFKDNSDRMRTGSIYDVVEVLKSLTFLSKSKSLSFREKRMLDRAKFLVVSEITEVMAEKTPVVEGKVEKALDKSFTTKTKSLAAAKGAPPVSRPVAVAPPRPPVIAPVKPVPAAVAAVKPVAVAAVKQVPAKPVAVAVKPAAVASVKNVAPARVAVAAKSVAAAAAPAPRVASKVAPRRAARA
jgi:CarD family transcriptional regulator